MRGGRELQWTRRDEPDGKSKRRKKKKKKKKRSERNLAASSPAAPSSLLTHSNGTVFQRAQFKMGFSTNISFFEIKKKSIQNLP